MFKFLNLENYSIINKGNNSPLYRERSDYILLLWHISSKILSGSSKSSLTSLVLHLGSGRVDRGHYLKFSGLFLNRWERSSPVERNGPGGMIWTHDLSSIAEMTMCGLDLLKNLNYW
jgi:hypothetical protein